MKAREAIIERLERYASDVSYAGRKAFFDAIADAGIWNRDHPEYPIPKMISGKVPVICPACLRDHSLCGPAAPAAGIPEYCCAECPKIVRQ